MCPALLPTTVTSISIPDPPLRIRHLRQPVSDVAVDAILPVLVEIAVVLNMSLGLCRTHAMAEGDQGRPACSARMMSASCLRSAVMSAVLSDCEKPPDILAERVLSWIDCTAEYRTGADPPRCFQRQRSSPDKGIADNVGPSADDIDCGTGRSSLACQGIDFCSRATELEIFDQAATGTARRATRRTGRDGR